MEFHSLNYAPLAQLSGRGSISLPSEGAGERYVSGLGVRKWRRARGVRLLAQFIDQSCRVRAAEVSAPIRVLTCRLPSRVRPQRLGPPTARFALLLRSFSRRMLDCVIFLGGCSASTASGVCFFAASLVSESLVKALISS